MNDTTVASELATANQHAAMIRRYWAALGATVHVEVGHNMRSIGPIAFIRSDLINGWPKDWTP